MTNKDKLKEILTAGLNVHTIQIIDESHMHAGHNPDAAMGGTHFKLLIVSDDFKGKTSVIRHKLIYKLLEEEFKAGLHALAIQSLTVQEYLGG